MASLTLLQDWHDLTSSVGIHGPLVRTAEVYAPQESSTLLGLPLEIRTAIWEFVLFSSSPEDGGGKDYIDDEDGDTRESDDHPSDSSSNDPTINSDNSPGIVRATSNNLFIAMSRPSSFASLVAVCKQTYTEASPLLFVSQTFQLRFHNQDYDPWTSTFLFPGSKVMARTSERVLRMPRRLSVMVELEMGRAPLLVLLTRLRLVLEERLACAFPTRVVLSLKKVTEEKTKEKVLRALPVLCGGRNAIVHVWEGGERSGGTEDVVGVGEAGTEGGGEDGGDGGSGDVDRVRGLGGGYVLDLPVRPLPRHAIHED